MVNRNFPSSKSKLLSVKAMLNECYNSKKSWYCDTNISFSVRMQYSTTDRC